MPTIMVSFALGFILVGGGIIDEKNEEIKELKAELAEHKRFCLLALPDWVALQNALRFLVGQIFATERELQLKQGHATQSEVHSLETLRAWQTGRFEELTALANKVTPYRVSLRLNNYR